MPTDDELKEFGLDARIVGAPGRVLLDYEAAVSLCKAWEKTHPEAKNYLSRKEIEELARGR